MVYFLQLQDSSTAESTVNQSVPAVIVNCPTVSETLRPDASVSVDMEKVLKKGRKRRKSAQNWAANVRKVNRDKGLSYVTRKGKIVAQKHPRAVDCSRCRFQCTTKFSVDEQQQLFKLYYDIEYERKYDFICANVQVHNVVRHNVKRKKVQVLLKKCVGSRLCCRCRCSWKCCRCGCSGKRCRCGCSRKR